MHCQSSTARTERLNMSQPQIKASEMIEQLEALIAKHGDLPIMFAVPDVCAVNVAKPKFAADDGDTGDCFIL